MKELWQRREQILGVVGFDGGSKPSMGFALAPVQDLMGQQQDDDAAPDLCPPADATIHMVTSGITPCIGVCADNLKYTSVSIAATADLSPAGGYWYFVTPTPETFVTFYLDSQCESIYFSGSTYLVYIINCSPSGWEVIIKDNLPNVFFYATGTGALPKGTPIANQLEYCDDESNTHGSERGMGTLGNVTLSW